MSLKLRTSLAHNFSLHHPILSQVSSSPHNMAHLAYYNYEGYGQRSKENLWYSQAVRVGDIIECSGQGSLTSHPPPISSHSRHSNIAQVDGIAKPTKSSARSTLKSIKPSRTSNTHSKLPGRRDWSMCSRSGVTMFLVTARLWRRW